MSPDGLESIKVRFNQIDWHDTELRGISVEEAEETTRVVLTVTFYEWDEHRRATPRPAKVVFIDCFGLNATMDLNAKAMASHHIYHAECHLESSFKNELRSHYTRVEDPLRSHLHFEIDLAYDPAGKIAIVATDFEVSLPKSE